MSEAKLGNNIFDSRGGSCDGSVLDRAAPLLPWNGGDRLISLWDMKEYLAHRLYTLILDVQGVQAARTIHDEDEDKAREQIKEHTKSVFQETKVLGLQSTQRQALRLYRYAKDTGKDIDEIADATDELDTRLDEELSDLRLFYIPNDKLNYYNKTDLFGDEFKTNFPQANAEIIEAGNCLAFDRYASCVFHLTRALEICLRVVFVSLGMPARIWSVSKWRSLLQRIDGKIKKNNQNLVNDPTWQSERPFYEKVHAFLAAATNPLRNSSVHVDVAYSEESSVRPVWLGVEAFMRHLATKLKE